MGFFSKVFKGVKKVFKKIGKGIKKVAGKVGKFMNKIGVVGQIAMAFILPGIGQALASTLGNVGTWAATALANPATNSLVKGVAHVVNGATKFAATAGRTFNTVTSAVKNYVGEVGKTMLNKIPGVSVENASANIFGSGGALDKAAQATGKTWDTTIGSGEWWDGFKPETVDPLAEVKSSVLETAEAIKPSVEAPVVDPDFRPPSLMEPVPVDTSNLGTPLPDYLKKPEALADVGSDYMITERSLAAAGTEVVKGAAQSLMAPEQEEYVPYGEVVAAENMYTVQASPMAQMSQMPQIGYGMPMLQYDAMYRPTSTYATRMQGAI